MRELASQLCHDALLIFDGGAKLTRAVFRLVDAKRCLLGGGCGAAAHLLQLPADGIELAALLLRRRPGFVNARVGLVQATTRLLRVAIRTRHPLLELPLETRGVLHRSLLLGPCLSEPPVRLVEFFRRLHRRRVDALGERVEHVSRLSEFPSDDGEFSLAFLGAGVRLRRRLFCGVQQRGGFVGHARGVLERLLGALKIGAGLSEVPLLLLHLVLEVRASILELFDAMAVLLREETAALLGALTPLGRLFGALFSLLEGALHLLQGAVLRLQDGVLGGGGGALPLGAILLVLRSERVHLASEGGGVAAVALGTLELLARAIEFLA